MIKINGRKKLFLIILVSFPVFLFISQIPVFALFGPKVVDVTPRAFSVVWTTGSGYTSCNCNIEVYTDEEFKNRVDLRPDQIVIETEKGGPGEFGMKYGIVKLGVVALTLDTKYYFKVISNGSVIYTSSVQTERFRGILSTDPNMTDLVSNDIVHTAVYKPDGTTPALGALVLGEILDPFNKEKVLSDHPLSGWVGEGMPGDPNKNYYDPKKIAYMEYAGLDMNNLYGTHRYPMSLHGDNPETPDKNEAEIIRFTIIHGTQEIFGQVPGEDNFIKYGRIESIEKVNGRIMVSAKVSAAYRFDEGYNSFAFPFKVRDGYTTGDLLLAIDRAEGIRDDEESAVNYIYVWDPREDAYSITFKKRLLAGGFAVDNPVPFQAGQGCFIDMKRAMTNDVIFYGRPEAVPTTLKGGHNVIAFPHVPNYYTTGNLINDLEKELHLEPGAVVINTFVNKWQDWNICFKSYNPFKKQYTIQGEIYIKNDQFHFTELDTPFVITDWDPFKKR